MIEFGLRFYGNFAHGLNVFSNRDLTRSRNGWSRGGTRRFCHFFDRRRGTLAQPNAPPRNQASNVDFFVGPENRLVGSAFLEFANLDSCSYSPLVLCGSSGTGKSCLAEHIANLRRSAVLTRGADFSRELAAAIDDQTLDEFRRKYRDAGLFILDDLLQLSGRTAALQELQHLLDEFEAREVPVLITSRQPPAEVVGLPPALAQSPQWRLSSNRIIAGHRRP